MEKEYIKHLQQVKKVGTKLYIDDLHDVVPVGTILYTASPTPPNGYLICNGATVGRGTYPDLFAAIGTTYGDGDGSTTFQLPNLMDKTVWGGTGVGTEKEAGLPNITGSIGGVLYPNMGEATSALTTSEIVPEHLDKNNAWRAFVDPTDAGVALLDMNASRSNPIYGNSNTVQPPATVLLPVIKAFGHIANPGDLDASKLAQDMLGYLPLSGGTMTGTIQVKSRVPGDLDSEPLSIQGTDSAKELNISVDDSHNGPYFALYGEDLTYGESKSKGPIDYSAKAGGFSIAARRPDPSDSSKNLGAALEGYTDGRLLWGGKPVECIDSTDGRFWVRYTNGIQICWGWVHAVSGATISYPVKFKADVDVPRVVLTPSYNSASLSKESGLSLFTWLKQIPNGDGFIIARGTEVSGNDYYFMYIAIGHWK